MAITPEEAREELKRRGEPIEEPGEVQKVAESPEIQAILGAGDIVRQQLGRLLPSPIRPTFRPAGDPTRPAYRRGTTAGEIASFLGAGEVAGTALGAARGIPALSKLAQVLSGRAGRVLGTMGYGAAVSPDRLRGAALGAGLGVAGEAIPAIAGLKRFASPQDLTNDIMKSLSGGRSIEENSKSLATDIKNSFNRKKGEASGLYDPLFDTVGTSSIYGKLIKSPELYKNIEPEIFDSYLPDIKKLHNKFLEKPTIQNAHDLQSQLGFEVRKLENQPIKSISDTRDMQNWRDARTNLREDAGTFLDLKDNTGGLSRQYDNATDFYRENVAPYLSNSSMAKIARGITTTPRNISGLFKFPTEDVAKVATDIGEKGQQKIVFSEIGKKLKMTPEKLTDEINKLETKGLSSYITPTLQQQLDKLPVRIAGKTALQRGVGLGAGLALAPHAGVAPEILAGAGGAALSPAIMRLISRTIPTQQISKGVEAAYPAARRATLGILLGQRPEEEESAKPITRAEAIAELKRRGIE